MDVQLPAQLVVTGEGIPQVCSRHGRESTRAAKCRFMSRPPAWAALLLLAGLVPYLIVVMALRKTVQAPYWPMCADCDSHKRRAMFGGIGGVGLSTVLFIGGFAMASSTTTTTDPLYGYETTHPSPSASLGLYIIMLAIPIFAVGAIAAMQASVPAVARGFVSNDGTFVGFRKPHPLFVRHVTEMLNGLQPVQTFGYPAPQPGQGYPAPQPGQGYPAPQPGQVFDPRQSLPPQG